jgi:4'-phosphopantetheinyl transferase
MSAPTVGSTDRRGIDGVPGTGVVHVWWIDLEEHGGALAHESVLDAAERARAERFRFERDRRRFIAGRFGMRVVLGRYLDLEPAAVPVAADDRGKPFLDPGADFAFNLSNSADLAVVAVTSPGPIGIDVEERRPDVAMAIERVAESILAPEEVRVLRGLDGLDRELAFFRCWTRKEAFLKALGSGLSVALDAFEVTLTAEAPPAVVRVPLGCTNAAEEWTLLDVPVPAPGFVAAVAVPHPVSDVEHFRWPPTGPGP